MNATNDNQEKGDSSPFPLSPLSPDANRHLYTIGDRVAVYGMKCDRKAWARARHGTTGVVISILPLTRKGKCRYGVMVQEASSNRMEVVDLTDDCMIPLELKSSETTE